MYQEIKKKKQLLNSYEFFGREKKWPYHVNCFVSHTKLRSYPSSFKTAGSSCAWAKECGFRSASSFEGSGIRVGDGE